MSRWLYEPADMLRPLSFTSRRLPDIWSSLAHYAKRAGNGSVEISLPRESELPRLDTLQIVFGERRDEFPIEARVDEDLSFLIDPDVYGAVVGHIRQWRLRQRGELFKVRSYDQDDRVWFIDGRSLAMFDTYDWSQHLPMVDLWRKSQFSPRRGALLRTLATYFPGILGF